MEFNSRTNSPEPARAPAPAVSRKKKHIDWVAKTVRFELVTVLVGSALLLAAISLYLAFTGPVGNTEAKQVDTTKYQAVFLNGGSTSGSVAYTTYFGHITSLNNNYLVLKNVYYLTTSATSATDTTATPTLTKLGCQQLHAPYDEMVINRSQVAFWENLQASGKVVSAINQYVKQNPKGPDCSTTSSSTSSTTTPATTTAPSTGQ